MFVQLFYESFLRWVSFVLCLCAGVLTLSFDFFQNIKRKIQKCAQSVGTRRELPKDSYAEVIRWPLYCPMLTTR